MLPRRCTLAVQQQPQQAKKTGAKGSSDSSALALMLADSNQTSRNISRAWLRSPHWFETSAPLFARRQAHSSAKGSAQPPADVPRQGGQTQQPCPPDPLQTPWLLPQDTTALVPSRPASLRHRVRQIVLDPQGLAVPTLIQQVPALARTLTQAPRLTPCRAGSRRCRCWRRA